MVQAATPPLVLASASPARRALLTAAGLAFEAVATGIDEAAIKRAALATGASAAATALLLASAKAQAMADTHSLVIGCDQILVCDGAWHDKPADIAAARRQLLALRGRSHTLATATVVLRAGVELWRHASSPVLTMRPFTAAFLDGYLLEEGDAVLSSVGAYRLEGRGIHLFERIEGGHSDILGLPLLPLLGFLRSLGILPD